MPVAPEPATAPAGAANVLVVDDEMLIAAYLEDTLEELGFQCCGVAGSAVEAMALARSRKPAIALVDIGLRGPTNGIELARGLQDDMGIAVVFLSGAVDSGTRRAAEAVGPRGFLTKPCSDHEIAAVLGEIVDSATAGAPRGGENPN